MEYKKLRFYLGLLNYYRVSIPELPEILESLNNFLGVNQRGLQSKLTGQMPRRKHFFFLK